jgi:hypothetical protein
MPTRYPHLNKVRAARRHLDHQFSAPSHWPDGTTGLPSDVDVFEPVNPPVTGVYSFFRAVTCPSVASLPQPIQRTKFTQRPRVENRYGEQWSSVPTIGGSLQEGPPVTTSTQTRESPFLIEKHESASRSRALSMLLLQYS